MTELYVAAGVVYIAINFLIWATLYSARDPLLEHVVFWKVLLFGLFAVWIKPMRRWTVRTVRPNRKGKARS